MLTEAQKPMVVRMATAVMLIDGEYTGEEMESMVAIAVALDIDPDLLMQTITESMADGGLENLLEQALEDIKAFAEVDEPETKETLLTLLSMIGLADGEIDDSELQLLGAMHTLWDL